MESRLKLTLAAMAVLTAASPTLASTITVGLSSDIRSSNPGINRDDVSDGVILNVVEGLVGYREDGTVGPLLAESIATSPDGLTYTFKLRSRVKFQNGDGLTSADILWNWNRYMDPKTEWRCISEFDGRNGLKVESASAPDPSTFVMTINKPNAVFLSSLARTDCGATAIISKASFNADGTWNKPIGTGPFKFAEWKRGDSIRLTKFDGYQSPPGDRVDGYIGAKQPMVDEVKFLVVADPASTKASLLTGALDAAQITTSDVPELRNNADIVVETAPIATKHAILIQTQDPLLSNVKLRQAIAAALDMNELVAGASDGIGLTNNSAVFRLSLYYDEIQKQGYQYDPDKARQLLKESGYKGEPITILTNKRTNVPNYPSALIVQAMLKAVGINLQLEVLEWPNQLDRYNSGKYQMMATSYSSQLDPSLSYDQFMGPKATQPRKVWDNPEARAELDKAMVTSDPAERQKIFDDLHRRQMVEVPLIIMYGGTGLSAHTKRVNGSLYWQAKPRLWEVTAIDR
jgi:peptide/nickel transport system substrate-binding protein